MLNETVVRTPWWARALVWLTVPVAGAGLLLLAGKLPFLFGFLRALPFWVAPGAGALLGLVLAGFVDAESLTVQVSSSAVVLTRPGVRRELTRADVALAFADRDNLVLLGRTGRELAREPTLLAPRRFGTAFTAYGIGWSDRDPYRDAYRRWVPGLPELPDTAHALFVARQTALTARDETDARELREELGRLGIVVRDDRKRQYWRRAEGG